MRTIGNAIGAILGASKGGGVLLLIVVAAVPVFITVVVFTDSVANILKTILPYVNNIVGYGLLVSVIVGIPMLFFQNFRPLSGFIFTATAWAVGFAIWITSVITIYTLWGRLATIASILVLPFIVPIAALAILLEGEWSILGSFAIAVISWFTLVGGSGLASSLYEGRRGRGRG